MENSNDFIYPTFNDKAEVIEQLSDKILMQNLDEQLSAVMVQGLKPVNIIDVFNERFNMINVKYREYDDILNQVLDMKISLHERVLLKLEERFDFQSNIEVDKILNDEFFLYVENLYDFFVINYKAKLISLLTNYIFDNRKHLSKEYKAVTDKKDLGIISLKKVFKTLDEVVIIYNLDEIIDGFINTVEENEYIIEIIVNNDEMEASNTIVSEIFLEDSVIDGFFGEEFKNNFFKPLTLDEFSYDLNTRIKNEVVKLLPKKNT